MKMRHLLVPVVALALSASTALAQGNPPPAGGPPPGQGMGGGGGNRGARRMQMLLQGITLTPAQQTSIDSINTAFQAKMPPFTPGQQPDSASMAQRRAIGQQRDAAIRGVLTPEQQRTWDTNMQNMQAQMGQRPGGE